MKKDVIYIVWKVGGNRNAKMNVYFTAKNKKETMINILIHFLSSSNHNDGQEETQKTGKHTVYYRAFQVIFIAQHSQTIFELNDNPIGEWGYFPDHFHTVIAKQKIAYFPQKIFSTEIIFSWENVYIKTNGT